MKKLIKKRKEPLDNFNSVLQRALKEKKEEEKDFPELKENQWYYVKDRFPPDNQSNIVTRSKEYGSFDISVGFKERQHLLMDIYYWKRKVRVDRWMLIM